MQEKGMKLPRGLRNNNPLNIRKGSDWKGLRPQQTDPAFCQFQSILYGIRAAFILMRNHISGFKGTRRKQNTIQKLISVWAPPSENATLRYVDTVAEKVGISKDAIIDPDDRKLMVNIAREMAFVECGVQLDRAYFTSAWDLFIR